MVRVVGSAADVYGNTVTRVSELQRNQVLARLPAQARDAIDQQLRREILEVSQVLCDEREPVRRVYFPVDAVISIVSLMENGAIAESYTAGCDGFAGLIKYTRGRVTVVDRQGLEEASCECYKIVADEFCRVLGGPQPMR